MLEVLTPKNLHYCTSRISFLLRQQQKVKVLGWPGAFFYFCFVLFVSKAAQSHAVACAGWGQVLLCRVEEQQSVPVLQGWVLAVSMAVPSDSCALLLSLLSWRLLWEAGCQNCTSFDLARYSCVIPAPHGHYRTLQQLLPGSLSWHRPSGGGWRQIPFSRVLQPLVRLAEASRGSSCGSCLCCTC